MSEEKKDLEEAENVEELKEDESKSQDWLDKLDPNSMIATAERFRRKRLLNSERLKVQKEKEEIEMEAAQKAKESLEKSKEYEELMAKAAKYDELMQKTERIEGFVKSIDFARDQCMQQLGYTWGYVQCIQDLLNSDEEADQNSVLGLVYQKANAKVRVEIIDEILPTLKDIIKENK